MSFFEQGFSSFKRRKLANCGRIPVSIPTTMWQTPKIDAQTKDRDPPDSKEQLLQYSIERMMSKGKDPKNVAPCSLFTKYEEGATFRHFPPNYQVPGVWQETFWNKSWYPSQIKSFDAVIEELWQWEPWDASVLSIVLRLKRASSSFSDWTFPRLFFSLFPGCIEIWVWISISIFLVPFWALISSVKWHCHVQSSLLLSVSQ